MAVLEELAEKDPSLNETVEAIKLLASTACNLAASQIASRLKIRVRSAEFDDEAFGGLLVAFGAAKPGQKCPKVLRDVDPGGDWEYLEVCNE